MSKSIVNRDLIVEAIREDELYVESFELFCQLHPAMEDRIRAAAVAGDTQKVREASHMLKSRLRFLQCSELGENAAQLERDAKHEIADCVARTDKLLSDIQVAVAEIQEIIDAEIAA